MEVKVKYRFIKIAPRKVRAVADLIRGKSYNWSTAQLKYLNKSAASSVQELLKSAFAAAKDKELDLESLYVKEIFVNEGPRLKRRRLASRGRAAKILKRMSHLLLTLAEKKEVDKPKGEKNGSQSKSK